MIKFLRKQIKLILLLTEWIIGFACWLEKRFPNSDQFSFEAPYKYMSLHIVFRYLLRIIFFNIKVNIPKTTIIKLKEYLKSNQLIICPTHTFIIEAIPMHELLGQAKQPFFLMIAREFFDLVLGLAEFPLKSAGCISVARGAEGAKESLKFATNVVINTKRPLIIFAEGESSLNLKHLLPLKKGIGLICKEACKVDKPISILPVSFRFTYEDFKETKNNLEDILTDLERNFKIRYSSFCYKERTLNLLEYVINLKLNEFNISSSESLISKSKLLYDTIHEYLTKKYNLSSNEERAYEIAIKRRNKNPEEDLKLVYAWIEIKALIEYIPNKNETDIAVWAALILKLIRITTGDYSNLPVNKIMKGIIIEPILGDLIPIKGFNNLPVESILDVIKNNLEKLTAST